MLHKVDKAASGTAETGLTWITLPAPKAATSPILKLEIPWLCMFLKVMSQ